MENMEAKVSLNLTLCYEHSYYAHKLQLKTLLMLKKRRAVQERGHPLQINKYLKIPLHYSVSAVCAEVCTESQNLCCSAKWVTNQKLHLNYVATPRKASCRHYKERDNNWLHTKTTSRKHSRCVSQRQYGVIWHLINRRRKNRCFKCQRGVIITTEQQREPFWSSNNMI